jgi:hypothetical protein
MSDKTTTQIAILSLIISIACYLRYCYVYNKLYFPLLHTGKVPRIERYERYLLIWNILRWISAIVAVFFGIIVKLIDYSFI